MTDRTVDAAVIGESFTGDLSMWGLFLQADVVVKFVMLVLMMASVWSWAIILEKRGTLKRLNKRAQKFEDSFWSGEPLDKLYQRVKKGKQDPLIKTFCAGMEEWHNGVAGGIPARESLQASLKQRVERAMGTSINKEMNALERGMTFLASVGSTATFIGLFGTVWGIMNSFTAIAGTNNTSLAVVAPGIAEALFATALGLVAAIPAVVSYNIFTNSLDRYADRLDTFVSEFSAILSRHLDMQDSNGSSSASASAGSKRKVA
ncbi:MAG: protein TolQ [Rhodospirillales bacterium]|nr:protein TolQ [Rhodospirillales bacterium]MCB9995723.1 protein TolQ [Rhodospirillales bacterium]